MSNLDTAPPDTTPACRSGIKSRAEAGSAAGGSRAGQVWHEHIELLTDYRVTSKMLAWTGDPGVRFIPCHPAFLRAGREPAAHHRGSPCRGAAPIAGRLTC